MKRRMKVEAAKPQDEQIAAEWVAIDELKVWASNPRKNTKAIKPVANSIARFGFAAPIIARRVDRVVIAGHTRLQAAKMLKLERVPVRFLDLSENEAQALALADNKLGEIAGWENETLRAILNTLKSEDADLLALAGFDAAALNMFPGSDGAATGVLGAMKFCVTVELDDEKAQAELVKLLEAKGYQCKLTMS